MRPSLDPFRFLATAVAAWANQQQQDSIEYLREENRVLREQLKGKRIPNGQHIRMRYLLCGPPVNSEGPEKIGLANFSSPTYKNARRASHAVRRPIVHLQIPSRSAVGKSRASASTQRSASLSEETEVDYV